MLQQQNKLGKRADKALCKTLMESTRRPKLVPSTPSKEVSPCNTWNISSYIVFQFGKEFTHIVGIPSVKELFSEWPQ